MNRVNTIDGVNSSLSAPNHTVACMLNDYCVQFGYTMLEQVGREYVARWQLDDAGNARAM